VNPSSSADLHGGPDLVELRLWVLGFVLSKMFLAGLLTAIAKLASLDKLKARRRLRVPINLFKLIRSPMRREERGAVLPISTNPC
jgi:hypothetical protein